MSGDQDGSRFFFLVHLEFSYTEFAQDPKLCTHLHFFKYVLFANVYLVALKCAKIDLT